MLGDNKVGLFNFVIGLSALFVFGYKVEDLTHGCYSPPTLSSLILLLMFVSVGWLCVSARDCCNCQCP